MRVSIHWFGFDPFMCFGWQRRDTHLAIDLGPFAVTIYF